MKQKPLFVILLFIAFLFTSCKNQVSKNQINTFMDNWHLAASNANADVFFGSMEENAVYLGTQADEIWVKSDFIQFAKPYFDRGRAWSFTPIERNIYFSENDNLFWFDESLETWMGICRGSGVIVKQGDSLKILHYNLAVTISNNLVGDFVKLIKQDSINHFLFEK